MRSARRDSAVSSARGNEQVTRVAKLSAAEARSLGSASKPSIAPQPPAIAAGGELSSRCASSSRAASTFWLTPLAKIRSPRNSSLTATPRELVFAGNSLELPRTQTLGRRSSGLPVARSARAEYRSDSLRAALAAPTSSLAVTVTIIAAAARTPAVSKRFCLNHSVTAAAFNHGVREAPFNRGMLLTAISTSNGRGGFD